MRFLIDASLSPRLAEVLTDAGHDAVHVQTAIAVDAADEAIFEHARLDQRVIVTADTDFGDLLAQQAPPNHQ